VRLGTDCFATKPGRKRKILPGFLFLPFHETLVHRLLLKDNSVLSKICPKRVGRFND
jgi:hypothetical protein